MKPHVKILLLLLLLPSLAFGQCYVDQSYGPASQHKYDLCEGQSTTLLVLVHGGGWTGGDKADNVFDNGNALEYVSRRYGLNVASVNYTLATTEVPTAPIDIDGPKPRPTHNVMTAARIIAKRIGATRVVLLGTSAGANISALTYAYYPDVVDGFIGLFGVYDLSRTGDFSPEVVKRANVYTGGDAGKVTGASLLGRPFPPGNFLLMHGNKDTVVAPIQSALMADTHGGELHIIDGANHGFKVFGEEYTPSPWTERIIRFTYTGE